MILLLETSRSCNARVVVVLLLQIWSDCTPSSCAGLRAYLSTDTIYKDNELHAEIKTIRFHPSFKQSAPETFTLPLQFRSDIMHTSDNSASTIALKFDGKDYHLSTLIVRDLCPCNHCVHESTNQKLFSTTDIPLHIYAHSVEFSDEKYPYVRLSWENDIPGFDSTHQTVLPVKDLLEVATLGAAPSPFRDSLGKHETWNAQSCSVANINYGDYMQNDITLHQTLRQLRSQGLLFVTNVPGVESSVSAIAERIGPVKETFYGYTWDGMLFILSERRVGAKH